MFCVLEEMDAGLVLSGLSFTSPVPPGTSECREKKGMELALLPGLGQD